jgi:hypothetical protein
MDTTLLICTLTLDSLEADTIAVRCILSSNVEIVYDYYRTIIGVKDISIEVVPVPATFCIASIGPQGDPDYTYPAYDIAMPKKNNGSYRALIQRTIEDERERVRLGMRCVLSSRSLVELSEEKQQLFASLHQVSSVLESVVSGGKKPDIVGWMISPRHIPTRDRHGIKLITDPTIGFKWDSLVGTLEFPDFIISRRITSACWKFQHPSTTKMLASIVEWWATAHMRTDTMWIHSSETEFDALLDIFRIKGVPTEYHAERMDPVRMALLDIEETVLGNTEIYSSTDLLFFSKADHWKSWIDRILRSKGVMLDSNVEFIQMMIQRWMRDGWGIRIDHLPYPSATPLFREAWDALLRLRPLTEDSILIWIRLLNMNDPVYTVRLNHEQKQVLLDDWIPVAASFLKASHPLIRAKSMATYAWIQKWILKFVPASLFKTFMLPKRMHPCILAAGYAMVHSTGGYFFVGLELPEAEQEVIPWGGREEVD